MKGVEDLEIWRRSDELAYKIYSITNQFPKHEEFALTSQIRRSALSVPANIVEGYYRNSKREFIRFLYISIASLSETRYFIRFALRLKYIQICDFDLLRQESEELAKMITGFIKSLKVEIA